MAASSPTFPSLLALGCARLGSALTPLSKRESLALIHRALDLGIRHFDTASIYGQGDSERYLGEALASHRGEVTLASKAGQRLALKQALMAPLKGPIRLLAARRGSLHQRVADQRARGVPRCFEPDVIERSLHASLKRLRTDHLDVFYLHGPDAAVLRDTALFERLGRLQRSGCFRWLGVSCDAADVAWAAADCKPVKVVQFDHGQVGDAQALMTTLQQRGKTAVLRGFVQGDAAALRERLQAVLGMPALGGLIVGTTREAHLQANVAAFAAATAATAAAAQA